jgi:drug/metabolite transporter (DMT)-like permease
VDRLPSRSVLALAATVVLWASAFAAIRVGLSGYGVAGLSFARLAVASAALAVAAPLLKVRLPLGEVPAPIALLGGLISIGGVVLINRRSRAARVVAAAGAAGRGGVGEDVARH